MKRQQQIVWSGIIGLAVLLISCSDLKTDLPTATTAGTQIHGQGWKDSLSANFHGIAIQIAGWNMDNCKECHGPDYKGGSSRSSCLSCHNKPGGPENCTVCHGGINAAPPRDLLGNTEISFVGVGAHQSHLTANILFATTSCNECHIVPISMVSSGHMDTTVGAEVQFYGPIVTSNLPSLAGPGEPSYSRSIFKCDNIYCHGYFQNGNNVSPIWNDTTDQYSACGSCHGDITKSTIGDKALPMTSLNGGTHPNDNRCYNCHPSVINSNYQLNVSKHVNGKIDF
jgi:predicted CxxxxCH...CXXCH cytochrome family protein